MNQSPPSLPSKKKKGKGCLIVLIGFSVLLVIGIIGNRQAKQDWKANRESLLTKIEAALNQGNPDEALKVARPYGSVDDPSLKVLVEKAKKVKADRHAESARIAAEEKEATAERLAEEKKANVQNEKAATTPPESSDAEEVARKLASLDAGKILPNDDPRLGRYKEVIERLMAIHKIPAEEIADVTWMFTDKLRKAGVKTSSVEMMEGIADLKEAKTIGVKYSECVALMYSMMAPK